MSNTASASAATASAATASAATVSTGCKYRTHYIYSWHRYQSHTKSSLQSIDHYNAACEEHAKLYEGDIMVLRDNVTHISGWHWCSGWPAQNCADTDGYVDVRTGKKYTLYGETSFFKMIHTATSSHHNFG